MAQSKLIRFRLNQAVEHHKKENPVMNGTPWNLKAFAAKYGINYDYLRQLLNGTRNLSEKACAEWEENLGLDCGFLTKPVSGDELSADLLPIIDLLREFDTDQISDAVQILKVIKNRK